MKDCIIRKTMIVGSKFVPEILECTLEEGFNEMLGIVERLDLSRYHDVLGYEEPCQFNIFGRIEGGRIVQWEIDDEWRSFGGSAYEKVELYEKTRYESKKKMYLEHVILCEVRSSKTGRLMYTNKQKIYVLDAIEASRESCNEIASRFGVSAPTVSQWRKQLQNAELFLDHVPCFLDITVPYRPRREFESTHEAGHA